MTGVAANRTYTLTICPAPDRHDMYVQVVALPGIVSGRMTAHASGVPQDGYYGVEGSGGLTIGARAGHGY
jgi:hypothetical protein